MSAAELLTWCRRRFQFSLGAMLLLLTVLGAGLGLLVRSATNQHLAVLAVQRMGGTVQYGQDLDTSVVTPRPHTRVSGLVRQQRRPRKVPERSRIRKLLGDDYFDRIVEVNLQNCNFSDEGLRPLAGLPALERLYLNNTNVTDTSLEPVADLRQLKILLLSTTEVGDQGLQLLESLTMLEYLDVRFTNVTAGGVERLQCALPDCEIEHGID